MRSTVSGFAFRDCLRRAGRLSAFEPLASAPTQGSAVVQIPPCEAVSMLGPSDHPESGPFPKHFYRLAAKSGTGPQAQSHTSGVPYPDVISHVDILGTSVGHGCRFHGEEQGRIQSFRVEVFLADSSKPHRRVGRRIHMPLYPRIPKALCEHAWLNCGFAYRRTQGVRTSVIQVEGEETEANIVSGFCEVLAKSIADHGLRYRRRSWRALAEKFSQWAQTHFAWTLGFREALHPGALKILNQATVLFEGFRNRGAP